MSAAMRIDLVLLRDLIPDPDADDPFAYGVDPDISCSRCAAVCCRLTVLLDAADAKVPANLTERTADGLTAMAHRADGYCVALAADGRSCGIYEVRQLACRRFTMGAPYCRSERERFLGTDKPTSPRT
jgi:hypothetical protein